MRRCSKCRKLKDITEFNFRNKKRNIRQSQCQNCTRLRIREHYSKRKDYYLKKAKIRNNVVRHEIKQYVWDYLNNHRCVDCGEKDPVVLEFDHQSDKISAISRMYRNYTLEKVIQEISKCQVRCANCHRRKTAKDLGWHLKFIKPL